MTSDKPGTVIPLAGERTSTPVDSNVTVISWGRLKDNKKKYHGVTKVEFDSNEPCSDTASHEKFGELTANTTVGASLRAGPRNDKGNDPPMAKKLKSPKPIRKVPKTKKNSSHLSPRELHQRPGQFQIDLNEYRQQAQNESTMNVHSKYLNIAKEDKFVELQRTERHHYKDQKLETNITQPVTATKKNPIFRKNINTNVQSSGKQRTKNILKRNWSQSSKKDEFEMYNIKSYYKNWRRQMGTQQNKLNVETFGFVNTHTCKRYLESAAPYKYQLKGTNDVVCYSTEGHYITDKDSGAPAIRQGRLVAVTIGGIECDGEHVAIGMKMNCYCSWIIDNLPHGSSDVSCCRNCCDIKHEDSDNTLRLRNKYI